MPLAFAVPRPQERRRRWRALCPDPDMGEREDEDPVGVLLEPRCVVPFAVCLAMPASWSARSRRLADHI
eukprot:11749898-Alexandrium_andersonii.AAC.1